MSSTEDRLLRADNRAAHDGKDRDPAHQPGPVVPLDPATMKPRRTNVTARDGHAAQSAARAALKKASRLSFEQQKERVRRLNSIMIAKLEAMVEGGEAAADTVLTLLTKASTIAKQWTVEERQAGPPGDADETLSDQELMKRARRGGS